MTRVSAQSSVSTLRMVMMSRYGPSLLQRCLACQAQLHIFIKICNRVCSNSTQHRGPPPKDSQSTTPYHPQYNKDDEAEEADIEDDLDKLFNKRQRQESQGEYENKALVDSFLAQMEVAVEEDMKDYEQGIWTLVWAHVHQTPYPPTAHISPTCPCHTGKPATHKLRMLNKVQQMLATKRLHNELLDGGLLGELVLSCFTVPVL